MAFLDNSGDIILDAVLTDHGRERLAAGDGTFRIDKFAFADDEINYALYQNSNHPDGANSNGSAYYDLEIMETPILEAFTNNDSLMKSKILSIPETNLLYLPVLKLNNVNRSSLFPTLNSYILAVDQGTEGVNSVLQNKGVANDQAFMDSGGNALVGVGGSGVLGGFGIESNDNLIEIDQGLDTTEISTTQIMDTTLKERAFLVEMDHRLLRLADAATFAGQTESFVDDDNIATYYVTKPVSSGKTNAARGSGFISQLGPNDNSTLAGPRGVRLSFKLRAQQDLVSATFLFTQLGGIMTQPPAGARVFYYVDTVVRVTGATTGYRIDIPVRCVKFKSN